jgi:hypothetical protein
MKDRVQSFLQQEQVQAALSRASSLARQWKVQERLSQIPPLLQRWQVQERIDHFYQSSIAPYLRQVHSGKSEEISRDLDGIIAQGLKLQTSSTDEEEQWKIDLIKWLNDGEVLLRENIPDEYRKIATFVARVSPYSDRNQLQQILSERLVMLTEIRKRHRERNAR